MNCPICNEKLTLLRDCDSSFCTTYRYVCQKESVPHFMTDAYGSEPYAALEVQSGNSFSSTSTTAYWNLKLGGAVVCSHCGNVAGTMIKGSDYDQIVQKNRFCNNCGRSMSKPKVISDDLPAVPEAITVADYNKFYHKYKNHAESFIKLLDSAIDKCNDSQDTRKQLECIGWSKEIRDTICVALEMYEQIMKSKCVGKVVKSRYRDVVLCENCSNCMIKTSQGYICKTKGLMPFDGYCSDGLVGKVQDGKTE